MKFIKSILLTCTAAALLVSCSSNSTFKIKGTVKDQQGKVIYLQKFEKGQPVTIDSTTIGTDGNFAMETKLPFTDYYQLTFGPGSSFVFVGDSVGEISFTAEKSLNEPSKIEGQEDTKIMYKFDNDLRIKILKGDSIMRSLKDLPQEEMMLKLEPINEEIRQFMHDFINKNHTSPAAMAALNKMNPIMELDYFKKVYDGIAPRMGRSEYYIFLKKQIEQAEDQAQNVKMQAEAMKENDKLLPIGSIPPPISLPDPKGKMHSLAEFKGKVVLIDFWASWCGPCREENPNVVRAYKEFHSKGFEILSVSLDKAAQAWKNAIIEDQLTWTHVSDLKFWQSKAAADYGVRSVPFAVLVDRDGKIVAKNLRGPALTQKLKEILG